MQTLILYTGHAFSNGTLLNDAHEIPILSWLWCFYYDSHYSYLNRKFALHEVVWDVILFHLDRMRFHRMIKWICIHKLHLPCHNRNSRMNAFPIKTYCNRMRLIDVTSKHINSCELYIYMCVCIREQIIKYKSLGRWQGHKWIRCTVPFEVDSACTS